MVLKPSSLCVLCLKNEVTPVTYTSHLHTKNQQEHQITGQFAEKSLLCNILLGFNVMQAL